MTLLLTSMGMRVKNEIVKILPFPYVGLSVAYITTASNFSKNKTFLNEEREALKSLGLIVQDIDIVGVSYEHLNKLLGKIDIIYIQGGNTTYLLKHVKLSGLDIIIKKLVNRGVIYIGVSAGSYIVCPSIIKGTWRNSQTNTSLIKNLGLNLVPFLICAHYENKHNIIVKQKMLSESLELRLINNNQALLVKGEVITLVGDLKLMKL